MSRPVAQAIGVETPEATGEIQLTSGGLFEQVFGSGSDTGTGKKDDGRKAYPLPPPDPSTVDWDGVPFHNPKTGRVISTDDASAEPIRDVTTSRRATPTASPRVAASAPAARPVAKVPAGLPSVPPDVPSVPSRSVASPTATSPGANSEPMWAAVRQLTPPPTTNSAESTSTTNELSSNTSSRRSGRKPIDPLEADKLAERASDDAPRDRSILTLPTVPPDTAKAAKAEPAKVAAKESPKRPTEAPLASLPAAPPAQPEPKSLPELPRSLEGLSLDELAETESVLVETPSADRVSTERGLVLESMDVTDVAQLQEVESADDPVVGTAVPLRSLAEMEDDDSGSSDEFLGSGVVSEQIANRFPTRPRGIIVSPAGPSALVSRPFEAASPAVQRLATSDGATVRVVTEGPAEIMIRQTAQYELRVENRGSTTASGVVVRTTLPPWAELKGHDATAGKVQSIGEDGEGMIEWNVDELTAGSVEKLFVRVRAVRAGTFDVATRWTTAPLDQTAKVTVLEPKLAIQIDGPDQIVFGQSERYRIRVLNPGDGTASNVVFNLLPEAGEPVIQKLGNIPAGKESSFEVELTARDRAKLGIRGSVMGDLDLQAEIDKSVSVVAAELEAILAGPPIQFQNTEATYDLELVNSGRVASDSVEAEIRLPAGMKYVGGISGAKVDGNRVHWKLASIPAGETRQFAFTCQLDQTGNHKLNFRCQGTAGGQANVELETSVQAIVDLKLTVQDPPAPAPTGAEVAYDVLIHNRGSKAAENVRVIGQFGHGIEPVRTEGQAGEVGTGQVLFSPIVKIEPGAKVQLRIIAKADAAGDHRFRAEVHSGETVLVAEEATIFVDMTRQRISRSGGNDSAR